MGHPAEYFVTHPNRDETAVRLGQQICGQDWSLPGLRSETWGTRIVEADYVLMPAAL